MNLVGRCVFAIAIASLPTGALARELSERQSATLYSAEIGDQCGEPSLLSLTRNETYGMWEVRRGGCDIIFGQLRVGPQNGPANYRFLTIGGRSGDDRSVIRDLGAMEWDEVGVLPPLCPRPRLKPGEVRTMTVDTSAGAKELSPEKYIVPAIEGHIYELRIRDEEVDQYVLVRVEDLGEFESCRLSWVEVDAPDTSSDCADE